MMFAQNGRGAILAISLLVGCVLPRVPLNAQLPHPSTIAFLSNRDNAQRGFDIFLIAPDGQKPVNVTKQFNSAGVTGASMPRLLAKRSAVLFFSVSTKSFKEIDLTNSTIRSVLTTEHETPEFDISPDQRFILYRDRVDTTFQLFEADLMSGARRNLTRNKHNNTEPTYSPDGSTISFVCDSDGSRSIAIMNRDGSAQRILTNNFGDDRFPRFSPDGQRIVFTSSRSATIPDEYHVYGIDVTGKNFSLLYDGRMFNTQPQFLKDGTSVVFVSANRSKKLSHVLLKNLQTGTVNDITKDLVLLSQNVVLSADGRYLAFEHVTIADSEILCYDLASGTLRNLTNSKSWDCSPSF